MNINTLRKNYDKLNPKERFAAIVAAGTREDDQERKALLQSAPRKTFSFPNTYGLSEAFIFLSMWHVLSQLGYAATFYFLLGQDETDPVKVKGYDFNDARLLIQRRILEGREAWRAICREYGVDPEGLLGDFPEIEMIRMTELIVIRANEESPLELTDLQEAINGYREAIETKRKDWE